MIRSDQLQDEHVLPIIIYALTDSKLALGLKVLNNGWMGFVQGRAQESRIEINERVNVAQLLMSPKSEHILRRRSLG
jgi:hypothetical protein